MSTTLLMLYFTAMVLGEEATCNSIEHLPTEIAENDPSNNDDHVSLLQIGADLHHARRSRSSAPALYGQSEDDPAHMEGPAKTACDGVVPGLFNGAAAYHEAVNRFSSGVFLEVGAFLGMSTCYMSHLLQAAPEKSIQFDVIDIWGSVERDFKPWVKPEFLKVMQRHGDDAKATFDYDMKISGADKRIRSVTQGSSMNPKLVNRYPDESISFLYLDTSHDHNFTMKELEMWYPKIKVGGMLCGDDFEHLNGVEGAVNDWTRSKGKDYRLVYSVHIGGAKANFCLDKHPAGSVFEEPDFAKQAAAESCDPVVPGFALSSAAAYNEAVSRFDSGIFVELGSFLGRSSCYMAQLLKNAPHGKNIKFDTIDTWGSVDGEYFWTKPQVKEEMRKHGGDAKDTFHYFMKLTGSSQHIRHEIQGSSQDKDVVNRYEDNSISFVYLDTSHKRDDTMEELSLWFPKLKAGGLLCGLAFQNAKTGAEDWAEESGNMVRWVYGATHPDWKGTVRPVELFCFDKNIA